MYEIKEIPAQDRQKLLDLFIKFYESDAVEHALPLEKLERTVDAILGNTDPIDAIGIYVDNELVGFLDYTYYFASEIGRTISLEDLYIDESMRGRGLGTKLLDYAINTLAKDFDRIRLEVTSTNTRAKKLYEGLGFRVLSYEQMILER